MDARAGQGTGGTQAPSSDPEADVPCEQEPLDGTWSEVEFDAGRLWHLAFADERAVALGVEDEMLVARVSDDAGETWSEAVRLDSDDSRVSLLGPRAVIAPDGSSAFAYWETTDTARWARRYTPADGWGALAQVAGQTGATVQSFLDNELVVRSDGRAVVAYAPQADTARVEYRVFDGSSWGEMKTVENTGHPGLFLGENELAVLYTEETKTDRISPARRTLDFATGWSGPEYVPNIRTSGLSENLVFEDPHGHAASVVRDLGSDRGVWVSVREGETWGEQERLGYASASSADAATVAAAADALLIAWGLPDAENPDFSELIVAERPAGDTWAHVTIPRSSNLSRLQLVGSPTGAAALVGTMNHYPETSLIKVFRRSESGTWYCPRLKEGAGDTAVATNDDGKLLVAVLADSADGVTIMRFEPR